MSDEVFESWYKTAEMFRSAIKNNSNLFPLADKYNTDDEELKRMLTKVKRANTKLGYDVLVELAFALNPESGEMVCCMCSTLDELGMPLSLRQSTRLLAVLNKINSECKSRRNSQSTLSDHFWHLSNFNTFLYTQRVMRKDKFASVCHTIAYRVPLLLQAT